MARSFKTPITVDGDISTTGTLTGTRFISNVATGTAPFTVSSTTLVTNLNADLLDGYSTATANGASTIVLRDASGAFAAGAITGTSFNSITGLSSTTPSASGTAAVGIATTAARADHVHPTTGLGLTSGTLAQFAATTSAQLLGVISDETGSGALVFGTSPSITTSLTTASASFDLINTNATIVNFARAATSLTIATSTANTTVNLATGATTGAKSINIGTGGTSGSVAIALGSSSGSGSVVTVNGTITGAPTAATAATAAGNLGYVGMPQNSRSGAYTLVAGDAGKHIYYTVTGQTVTIPANSSVSYQIGTTITFITAPSVSLSIAITTDTMYLAGTGTTGTRTLAALGMATAVKITATTWIISGNGLT